MKDIFISAGISREHLDFLEEECLESPERYYKTYSQINNSEEMQLVPTDLIKGIDTMRSKSRKSWFYNLINADECNFRISTIKEFLSKITPTDLENFRESFKNEKYSGDNLRFVYFEDEGKYFAVSGGSHRTLFAKLVNAPYVYAKVTRYKLNQLKTKNFNDINQLTNELKSLVQELGLNCTQKECYTHKSYCLINYKTIPLLRFENKRILDFANQGRVNELYNIIEKQIDYLKLLKNKHEYYSRSPKLISKIIFLKDNIFIDNKVINDLDRMYKAGVSIILCK
ncbi:hypothetical protein ACTWQB_14510 [Piscibacillus sp. B03]|uniref:hypothetical protein n=1 Tax=Piscibacillus sp. B03 TaxID=3457430 RepID=UPI003FCC8AB7